MNWATERPTKPGYYWWRFRSDRLAHLVNVTMDGHGILQTHPPEQLVDAGLCVDTSGEWAGPVEQPE
jgi:hypothetical protein